MLIFSPYSIASEETQYKEYIVVGTSYYNPAEDEPSKGRLLIFEVTNVLPNAASSSSTSSTGISPANRSGKGIQLVASKLILAAVYTLAPGMRGTVVGGIGSKVSHLICITLIGSTQSIVGYSF